MIRPVGWRPPVNPNNRLLKNAQRPSQQIHVLIHAGTTALLLSCVTMVAYVLFVAVNLSKFEQLPSVSSIIAYDNVNTAVYLLAVVAHVITCALLYFLSGGDDEANNLPGARSKIPLYILAVYALFLYAIALLPVDKVQMAHRAAASCLFVTAIVEVAVVRYLTTGCKSRLRNGGCVGRGLVVWDMIVLVGMTVTVVMFGVSIHHSDSGGSSEWGDGAIFEYVFIGLLLLDRIVLSAALTADLRNKSTHGGPINLMIGLMQDV